jgi:hypothetical protein
VGLAEGGFHGSQATQLILGTDPLALIALGGFVTVVIVTLPLFIFALRKLPSRRWQLCDQASASQSPCLKAGSGAVYLTPQ